MDISLVQLAVAGTGVSIVISLIRRYTKWSSDVARYMAVAVCMLVVLAFQYIQSNPSLLQYVQDLVLLYGAGQGLYNLVLKPTQVDRIIEGEKDIKNLFVKE